MSIPSPNVWANWWSRRLTAWNPRRSATARAAAIWPRHRGYRDDAGGRMVCGYNPEGAGTIPYGSRA